MELWEKAEEFYKIIVATLKHEKSYTMSRIHKVEIVNVDIIVDKKNMIYNNFVNRADIIRHNKT